MSILVADHLHNARALANSDEQRPTEASLRRAVSTAYYALFQALCKTCASRLVGDDAPWEIYTPIFRSLDHRQVALALRRSPLAGAPKLQRLGNAFAQLLEFRVGGL